MRMVGMVETKVWGMLGGLGVVGDAGGRWRMLGREVGDVRWGRRLWMLGKEARGI